MKNFRKFIGQRSGESVSVVWSRRARVAGATIAAGALFAGMAAAGAPIAAADEGLLSDLPYSPGQLEDEAGQIGDEVEKLITSTPNPSNLPNLVNQDPKNLKGDGLNVVVGKSVVATTDPGGTPGMTVLVSNTQVSGTGKATVKVPMGATKVSNSSGFGSPKMDGESVVYDVENSGTQVQQFGASNGTYKAKLPVKVEVTATVDGKEVPADQMTGISGKVQVNYKFKNVTGEHTKISYKDPNGNLITENVEIPVPFGGSFNVTFPNTWTDINAPWAQGGMQPTGTTLTGTIMLLPPLGNETTLSITARANKADLPPAQLQAMPIALSDYSPPYGKLAFDALPIVNEATELAYQGGVDGQVLVLKLQAMLMKYGAMAEGLVKKYVDPTVKAFEDGTAAADVKKLTTGFTSLADGSEQLSELLPSATMVIGMVNSAMNVGVNLIEKNDGTIDDVIGILNSVNKTVKTMMPKIEQYVAWAEKLAPSVVNTATEVAEAATTICPKAKKIFDDVPMADIDWFLNEAATVAGWFDSGWKVKIQKFKDNVDNFYNASEDDLALCVQYAPEVVTWLKALASDLPNINKILDEVVDYAKLGATYLEKGVGYLDYYEANKASLWKMVDNNDCPKTPAGIKQCGLQQQLNFLYAMMQLATTQVAEQMVPGTEELASYVPLINKYFDLAQKYVPMYGKEIEAMLPELINYAKNELNMADEVVNKFTSFAGKAEESVAKTTAVLEVANDRAESGQGIPAGPVQGANSQLGVYQYSILGASKAKENNLIMVGLAALLILITAGVGTAMYRRNH